MKEQTVYLDSSSIVKRYLTENGSDVVDWFYRAAEVGRIALGFSLWNVGEVIGTLDRRRRQGDIDEAHFSGALDNFYGENEKMLRLNSLRILNVDGSVLRASWRLIPRHHTYAADALQVASAKELSSDLFVSADKRLCEVAGEEDLSCINPETDRDEARDFLDRIL